MGSTNGNIYRFTLSAAMVLCVALSTAQDNPANDSATTGAASGLQKLETVATFEGPMPTGVTISRQGRIFVCFPRWGDNVEFTVGEVKDGKVTAYPDQDFDATHTGARQFEGFVSVQSVVVDPANRLWALDTGSIRLGPVTFGGPKLVGFDLENDKVTTTILIPQDVALKTTYLNDVRFDLTRGRKGMAFITDSSPTGLGAIIVVDLETGDSWRTLGGHKSTQAEEGFVATAEGKPLMKQPTPEDKPVPARMAADSIAISADGLRLYYAPLTTHKFYSVSVDGLVAAVRGDEPSATVREERPRQGASDGLESDADRDLYLTDYEHHSIVRRDLAGNDNTIAEVAPIEWPDTLSLGADGYLYIMANQLHRQPDYNAGQDLRQKPYRLYRIKIDAKPVLLK